MKTTDRRSFAEGKDEPIPSIVNALKTAAIVAFACAVAGAACGVMLLLLEVVIGCG